MPVDEDTRWSRQRPRIVLTILQTPGSGPNWRKRLEASLSREPEIVKILAGLGNSER